MCDVSVPILDRQRTQSEDGFISLILQQLHKILDEESKDLPAFN